MLVFLDIVMATLSDSINLYRERGQVAAVVQNFEAHTDHLAKLPTPEQWMIYKTYLEACLEYKPAGLKPEILQRARQLSSRLTCNEVQILHALEGISLTRNGKASSVSEQVLPRLDGSGCNLEATIWLRCLIVSYCLRVGAHEEASYHFEALLLNISVLPTAMRFAALLAYTEINLLSPETDNKADVRRLKNTHEAAVHALPAELIAAYQCKVQEMHALLKNNPKDLYYHAQNSTKTLHRLQYHFCVRPSELLQKLFSETDQSGATLDSQSPQSPLSAGALSDDTLLRPLIAHQILRFGYTSGIWRHWDNAKQQSFLEIQYSTLDADNCGIDLYTISSKLRQAQPTTGKPQISRDGKLRTDLPDRFNWEELAWIRGEVKDMLASMSLIYQALQAGQLDAQQLEFYSDSVDAMVANIRAQAIRQFLYFGRSSSKSSANLSSYQFSTLLDQGLRRIAQLRFNQVRFNTDVNAWPKFNLKLDRRMAEPIAFIMAELAGSLVRKSWPDQAVSVRLSISESSLLVYRVIELLLESDRPEKALLIPEEFFKSRQIIARCAALATMFEANEGQFSWHTGLSRVTFRIEVPQKNVTQQ